MAFGLVAGIYLASWLLHWAVGAEIALGLLVIVLASAIVGALSRWPSQSIAAHEADQRLDLEDRLLTALDSMRLHRMGHVAQLQVIGAVHTARTRLRDWQMNRPALKRLAVNVAAGSVTLRGSVASFYEKQIAIQTCRVLAGIERLVDAVEVASAN